MVDDYPQDKGKPDREKRWARPMFIEIVRDKTGPNVLIGCKSMNPPMAGPGTSACISHYSCCEGGACLPACSTGCAECEEIPHPDSMNMCDCAEYYRLTGHPCHVSTWCLCHSLGIS